MVIYRATGDMTRPEAVETDKSHGLLSSGAGYFKTEDEAWKSLIDLRLEALGKAIEEQQQAMRARHEMDKKYRESQEGYIGWLESRSSPSASLPSSGSGSIG